MKNVISRGVELLKRSPEKAKNTIHMHSSTKNAEGGELGVGGWRIWERGKGRGARGGNGGGGGARGWGQGSGARKQGVGEEELGRGKGGMGKGGSKLSGENPRAG